ncbi:MAG TPA: hemolysin family protein [Verrucomicrobiae bacterium]|jgi:CBS domain containing-hemolysin-like protein|nr:hemolysin family protein [Verrucomicrobiae bacterium]
MTPALAVFALVVFCGASFFFALAETALFSLGKWQALQLEERSPSTGKVVNQLLAGRDDLLATLVLGNSFANAGIVAVSLWVVFKHHWPFALLMGGVLLFILFAGEVAPKALGVRAPELWSLRVARPMLILGKISRPFRQIAQSVTRLILGATVPAAANPPLGVTDEEYQELLEMAFQQGALAATEKEIILQIINLDRRKAGDVMRGRTLMASISDELTVEEMLAAARKFKRRRLPIYDETPDTIVGVLNTQVLLLDPEVDLSIAIEFPSFVPESMNLLQLLKSLQRQQRGLAIVLDEFGGTAGVVTIEDILAEVVGEPARPHDREAVVERLGENRWRVAGGVAVDDFRREYPALPGVSGIETMGGLALDAFQVVPSVGESVVRDGLRLTVQAADERRIRELLVETVKKR